MRRVAVTGRGLITPLGSTTTVFFESLMSGKSGIGRMTSDFSQHLAVKIAAEVSFEPSEYFSKKQTAVLDRASQLALAAGSRAWGDSGLILGDEEKERAGVYMGTGMGGTQTLDEVFFQLYKKDAARVSPLSITKIMSNAPASHVSMRHELSGPCLTFSTACSSSAVAIGEAYRLIKSGFADVMLAGGTESLLTYVSFKCWESLGVLAREDAEDPSASCRPFSMDRTGLVLGEGAAVIVLEEMERAKKRGATIYGEVTGYGSTADAYHITGPSATGQARAMSAALKEAMVSIEEIDYINAHGTATVVNDIVETRAIKNIFGERAYSIPTSSTKSMHAHLMGAAGAVEFIVSLLALENSAVPPTAHLSVRDPECDLDYVAGTGRTGVKVRTIMSNSFAFGGTNAVLVAKKYE